MAAIINYIKEHEKICLGLSLATLATYLIFRQKNVKKKNILEVSLKELVAHARHPQVRKIVITNNPKSTGSFRRNLVSFLKSKLLEEKIKVLINCSVGYLRFSRRSCSKLGANATWRAWRVTIATTITTTSTPSRPSCSSKTLSSASKPSTSTTTPIPSS